MNEDTRREYWKGELSKSQYKEYLTGMWVQVVIRAWRFIFDFNSYDRSGDMDRNTLKDRLAKLAYSYREFDLAICSFWVLIKKYFEEEKKDERKIKAIDKWINLLRYMPMSITLPKKRTEEQGQVVKIDEIIIILLNDLAHLMRQIIRLEEEMVRDVRI